MIDNQHTATWRRRHTEPNRRMNNTMLKLHTLTHLFQQVCFFYCSVFFLIRSFRVENTVAKQTHSFVSSSLFNAYFDLLRIRLVLIVCIGNRLCVECVCVGLCKCIVKTESKTRTTDLWVLSVFVPCSCIRLSVSVFCVHLRSIYGMFTIIK